MTTLDELRRANLKEQKEDAQERAAAKPAVAVAPPVVTSEAAPAAENKNGHNEAAPVIVREKPARVVEAVTQEPSAAERERIFFERVQKALSRKAIHATGAKATVDMPSELFWRVKRYCHDHNNVTMRQLFLDVVNIFLDEEGY